MATQKTLTIGLQMQADFAQAQREMKATAERLDKMAAAAAAVGDKGAFDKLTQGAREAELAAAQMQRRLDQIESDRVAAAASQTDSPFVASLREQVAAQREALIAQRLGAEELLRYRAAQAGAGAAAEPLIQQLARQRAAFEAAAQAAARQEAAQRQAMLAEQQRASAGEALLASLREQVALEGKSAAEVLRYRAAQLGVGAQAEKDIAAIEARTKKLGVSAGQTAAAMRMLPAQITDITTQLAAGAPVWMVAIQQGGQIKDSFGGAGAAVTALKAAITPTVVTIAAVAAVAGVAALAMHHLQAEQAAYSAALVASNNAAGTSIDQMRQLARQVSAVQGTTGAAADAIAQLTASGRVSGSALEQAATVAIRSQRLLGREVSSTVAIYAQLGKDPVQTLLKLNEGTNFLTAGILRQVMALKSQGNDLAAAELAQKAWGDAQAKVLADAEKNLGSLQKAWKAVADVAKGAWDAMLGIGREKPLQQQIDELRKALDAPPRKGGNPLQNDERRQAIRERLDALLEQQKFDKQAGAAQAARVDANQKQIDELDPARAGARASVRKAQIEAVLQARLASLERERQSSEDFFREDEIDAQQHQENLLAIDQAGLQARLDAMAQQRAVAASRPTKDLNEQLAAKAEIVAIDTQRAELEQKIRDLLRDEAIGARDIVPKARTDSRDALRASKAQDETNVEEFFKNKPQTDLAALQKELDLINKRQALREKEIGLQVKEGDLSQLEGQRAIVDSYKEQADAIDALIPKMDELAKRTGDKSIALGVDELKLRSRELRAEMDPLREALRTTFEGSVASAIENIATRTMSLADAARSLLIDIARGIAKIAAQELAHLAVKKLLSVFTQQQAATEVAAQATRTGAAVTGITTVAAAETAASTQVAAAAAPAAAATATWSWGAAALAGLAALAAIYALAKGFESGGQIRGPGTATSDSIPIWASDGEFMVRAKAAQQPGAVAFLQAFNEHGMALLDRPAFADGGLVMDGVAPLARPRELPTPVLKGGNVDVPVQVLNLFDHDAFVQRLAQSRGFRKVVTNMVVEERGTIQGGWGG